MPFKREDVIAEARSWLGTPWHHQAAVKAVGCDCIGFVRGVAERFLGPIPMALDYTPTWHLYRAEPRMFDGFRTVAEEIDPAGASTADILLFGAGKGPAHHCAFLTTAGGLIHCYQEAGRVVEHDFSPLWRPRLRHAFRFPGAGGLELVIRLRPTAWARTARAEARPKVPREG